MHFAKTALAHKFSLRRSSLTAAAAMVIAASLAAAPAVFAAKESEHHMDLGPGCAPERQGPQSSDPVRDEDDLADLGSEPRRHEQGHLALPASRLRGRLPNRGD
jgi:hypothetical protein